MIVAMIEEASFFRITCDGPHCASSLKVMAITDEPPGDFSERAVRILAEMGWTEAPHGQDLCRDCSPQRP